MDETINLSNLNLTLCSCRSVSLFVQHDVIVSSSVTFVLLHLVKLLMQVTNYCECFSGPHTHIRTRTLACLMNWLDGGARAPDMSKGKGNHCKSHSVTCASFWKKKYPGFFLWPLWFPPHFGSVQTLLHTSSISSPESVFFLPHPPADIHSSPFTFRLKGFFNHYFLPPLKYLKLLLGFVRVWSGDLEMKTDSPLICRIWIGIACASGEQKFY